MTAISNTSGTGDRYPNGDGLRLFVAADTALGANAPTCVINYLDTAGNAGATTTFTSTASLGIGQLLNTGAAANKYNPFLPLAAGEVKCTAAAGKGELQLDRDFSTVERGRLEAAIEAFFRELG